MVVVSLSILLGLTIILVIVQYLENKKLLKSKDEKFSPKTPPRPNKVKVPLVLKRGDRGIANYRVPVNLWPNTHPAWAKDIKKCGRSDSRTTVKVEVELIDVFGTHASVKVISVHDHRASDMARDWLNHLDAHIEIEYVQWRTNNDVLKMDDDAIIALYQNKTLKAGNIDIEYTGDSSPIELIDKLIV